MDWTSGYVADIGYTFGYYQELNPIRSRLALLHAGFKCQEIKTACELGFGQGLSVNIHASASNVTWYGTDFNPSQASFAQELSEASSAKTHLTDQAFAEFCYRDDLPDFDYIGLHGIWSWISNENRNVLVDFVRRKLKVGGILYVSYNTLPGWAAFAPMRHLMTEHAEIIGAEGRGIVNRINDAIDFADKLLSVNPIFLRANPLVGERIKKLKDQSRHYLAHEYFNRDWHPMHFSTMADWLGPSKVQFACSAHYLDQIDAINLTQEQQSFLNEVPDPMFRESVRDFVVNQQFRRDYWVKGARKLSALEQSEQIRCQSLLLVTPREDVNLKVQGSLGEAALNKEIYEPILDFMANYQPTTIRQIEQRVASADITFAKIVQATMVLIGAGYLSPVQATDVINQSRIKTDRLNGYLINKSRSYSDLVYLASPVTGGGVVVSRFHQLFLLALINKKKQPSDWAEFAWQILSSQGQRIVKEGIALEMPQENLAELMEQAKIFATKSLPILRALQVV